MFTINIDLQGKVYFHVTKEPGQTLFNVSLGVPHEELSLISAFIDYERTSQLLHWIMGPMGAFILAQNHEDSNVEINVRIDNHSQTVTISTKEDEAYE